MPQLLMLIVTPGLKRYRFADDAEKTIEGRLLCRRRPGPEGPRCYTHTRVESRSDRTGTSRPPQLEMMLQPCEICRPGANFRGIRSETAIDGEGRQYEYQGVDDGPDKRYPGRHFEVSCLVYAT